MITIKIEEDTLLEMLIDRLKQWEKSSDNLDLFEAMYENMVFGGCFNDAEIDLDAIVDNDVINYCSVIYDNEDNFAELLEAYKNGDNEACGCIIEAVSEDETRILVRWY